MSSEARSAVGGSSAKALSSSYPRDILFYGDSLTWGMAHKYTGRYDQTWPRLIERRLNARGYNVIESALCSRTTALDDPHENDWLVGGEPHDFNGLAHFVPEMMAQECRAVVILLGTNDLKVRIRAQARLRARLDAHAIASACARIGLLARQVQKDLPRLRNHPFTVVMVSPPPVRLNQLSRDLGYDETSVRISHDFPAAYKKVCKEHGFEFVELKNIDMEKSVDGVHVTPEATKQIAEAVWEVLDRVLERRTPIPSLALRDSEDSSEEDREDGNPQKKMKPNSFGSSGGSRRAAGGNDGKSSRNGGSSSRGTGGDGSRPKRNQGNSDKAGSSSSSKRQDRSERNRRAAREVSEDEESSSSESDDEKHGRQQKTTSARADPVKQLVWNQCRECNKWRMTSPSSLTKARWTCKNEFWSDRLEEWKLGCGWSVDPFKDDNGRMVPTRGLPVQHSRLAAVVEQQKQQQKQAAKEAASANLDDATESEGGEDEIEDRNGKEPSSEVESASDEREDGSNSNGAKSVSGSPMGRAGAVPIKPRGRGRPPGSTNKPKVIVPASSILPQAMPNSAGSVATVTPASPKMISTEAGPRPMFYPQPTAKGMMAARGLPTLPQGLMPTIVQHPYPMGTMQMPTGTVIATPQMFAAGMPRAFPQAMAPQLIQTGQTQQFQTMQQQQQQAQQQQQQQQAVQQQQQSQQQQQQPVQQQAQPQQGQQQGGKNDVIRKSLIPFLERNMNGNVPQQFRNHIMQLAFMLANDQLPPLRMIQTYTELRQLFASMPHLMQEMDSVAQTHPVLSSCFMPAAPQPQIIYFHDVNAAAAMQAMQSQPIGFMQQPGAIPGQSGIHFIQMPPAQIQQINAAQMRRA